MTDIDQIIDKQKRINLLRKQMFPGWPTHKSILHTPDGVRHLLSENVPLKRLNDKHYCKYCYSEHRNWWLMDENDYNFPGDSEKITVILCGDCEHTSVVEWL